MNHRTKTTSTQTYRRTTPKAALVGATLAGVLVVPLAGASTQPAGPVVEFGTPAPPVAAAFASVDTNRDGGIDKIVLVDPSTMGSHRSAGASASTAGTARRPAVSPSLAKLTKQLAAAKVAAAKAAAANVKAQRAAATLARAAKTASATARTARQRTYARQLARKAVVAARVAKVASTKSKAAASLVKTLKKAIDRVNRVGVPAPTTNTPTPTTNAPTPTANTPKPPTDAPAPTPAPTPVPVSSASCDSIVATFRPIPVSSNWQVSCVDSFPGVTSEAGYTVLGLTRYDTSQGLAQVMILRSQAANQLSATLAHELAHAYSITSMTYAQRSVFLNRIRTAGLTTATDFFSQSVSYDTMPAEIWARTQASCVGYPAPYSTFTEAKCTDVQAAIGS